MSRGSRLVVLAMAVAAVAFVVDVLTGPAPLGMRELLGAVTGDNLIATLRLHRSLVAVLAGAALGVAGLMMQTTFHNALAGPYVLGISSGASLGVALLLLSSPLLPSAATNTLIVLGRPGAALLGAAGMLGLVGLVGRRVPDTMTLLVLGVLCAAAIGSAVQILQYLAPSEALKTFVVWSLGSLSQVGGVDLATLSALVVVGLGLSGLSVKALNLLLLGTDGARSLGLDVLGARRMIFVGTTLLAGGVTAYCGPIGFLGLAMPHLARALSRSADHAILLPLTALLGATALLLCDAVAKLAALPINALTALLAIPIIVVVVLRGGRM